MAEEQTPPQSKSQSEIILSRRIFLAGCLGLPWLWICNVLYFRKKVFGPCVFFEYWPGRRDEYLSAQESQISHSDNGERNGVGGQERSGGGNGGERITRNEKMELEKWVKRSTTGALLVCSIFITWIVVFQVNKDNFGNGWFVMDMTEEESSGW